MFYFVENKYIIIIMSSVRPIEYERKKKYLYERHTKKVQTDNGTVFEMSESRMTN